MATQPGSTATTITLFGASSPLDHALSDQLGRRGCRTHFVTVPTGWLPSTTHAIVRIDTAAGEDALTSLAHTDQPPSHVIAVCPEPSNAAETARVRELCQACGTHHEVSLIWHPPLDAVALTTRDTAKALAASVADEVMSHAAIRGPSFVTRPFVVENGDH